MNILDVMETAKNPRKYINIGIIIIMLANSVFDFKIFWLF